MKSLKYFLLLSTFLIVANHLFGQVVADFTSNVPQGPTGCAPLTVEFFDESAGPVNDWVWHFGDGDTSSLQNPTHTYGSPGIYDVTLTVSGGGVTDTKTVNDYVVATELNVSASITDATCGNANGVIALSVTGGIAPYFVVWPNGDTTLTTDNLSPGAYTVVIEDSSGCRFQETYQVGNSNNNLTIILDTIINESAHGTNDGLIDVSVTGGTPPYSYAWSNGVNIQDISGLEAGTYCLLVTDANGCVEDGCFTVGRADCSTFTLTGTVTDANCHGNDGAISINVTGGTSPYYYIWSNGDDDPLIDNLNPGNYTVTVEDTLGCRLVETFMVGQEPGFQFSAQVTDVSIPFSADGAIDLTVNGGTPPYSFEWPTGDFTEDIDSLTAGTYCVTITDAAGCVEDPCFVVEHTGCNNFTTTGLVTHIGCNGTPQGAIDLTVSGGTPPFTYFWSTAHASEDIFGLSAGEYHITVEDSIGCSVQDTFTVGYAGGFHVTGTVTNATAGAANGIIEVAASGGTPPYQYSWDGGSTYTSSHIHDNLAPGTYCVLVKDSNECIEDLCFTVGTQGSCNNLEVTAWNDIYLCGPGSTILEADAYHGTPPYSFQWSPATALSSPNDRITHAQVNVTTHFIVEVTDANACTATDTVTVFVTSGSGNTGVTFDTVTICAGDTVQLSAFGGQSYVWTPSAHISDAHNNDPLVYPEHPTTYLVTIQDSGCTITYSVYVDIDEGCVWPGDANDDGIADNNDVLAIGIGYGINGPTRPNATLNWKGQFAPDWLLALASGANLKHVDCNGDGTIDGSDTTAIVLNYGQTHNKNSENGKITDPHLYFEIPEDTALAGTEIDVPVYFGQDTLQVNNFYGMAFTINYDNALVEEATMHFDADNSWVGTVGQNLLSFDHDLYNESQIDIAVTKIDQVAVSGFGQLGTLSFTMKDDISGKDLIVEAFNLSFSDVNAINADEVSIPIFHSPSTFYVKQEVSGIGQKSLNEDIKIYPNPTYNVFYVDAKQSLITELSITNILGKELIKYNEINSSNFKVNLGTLIPGNYFIKLLVDDQIIVRQLVLTR